MTVQLLIRAQCVGVSLLRDAQKQKETNRTKAAQKSTNLGQMMLGGEPQTVHRVGTAVCPLSKLL